MRRRNTTPNSNGYLLITQKKRKMSNTQILRFWQNYVDLLDLGQCFPKCTGNPDVMKWLPETKGPFIFFLDNCYRFSSCSLIVNIKLYIFSLKISQSRFFSELNKIFNTSFLKSMLIKGRLLLLSVSND